MVRKIRDANGVSQVVDMIPQIGKWPPRYPKIVIAPNDIFHKELIRIDDSIYGDVY